MAALAGRRALVTGGGRGIGREIAIDLARQGAAVAIGARTTTQLDEVAASIAVLGVEALVVELDVSRVESVREGIARASSRLGGVDILVNGAGVAPSAPLVRTPDSDWHAAIGTNLSGCFYTMREALPGMIERGWGRVVNVASIAGKTGYPYTAAYAASKHGVLGLTRTAALEVAERGVTVNAVCPGYVDTPMTDAAVERIARKTGADPGAIRRRLEEMSPQRRLVTSAEVSALVLFLCGDSARGINGQALSVDGGTVVA
jgi:3-hydroxybutyrate dehydrogenase